MPLADEQPPRAGPPLTAAPGSDAGSWFLLAAIAALLIARLPVAGLREFDNDELEHAHAAWSVFRGLLPYQDFFEHHTPWYYFALAPFFRWFAVDQSFEAARHFLFFARLLSFALAVLSTVLVFLVGRMGGGRRVGLLAALFFVAQPVLFHKTVEIRPDVPGLAFFVLALWFLLRGLRAPEAASTRRLRWLLGGGLCLGAAVMCTQKLLFVLPGAFVGLGLWALAGGRRAFAARALAVVVALLGVALPVAITWLAFARRGGAGAFVYNNFVLNSRWRWYSGRHLLEVIESSAPILLLCLIGAWSALFRRGRAASRDPGDVLLLCTLAGLAAGLIVVPAAYEQFYLPHLTIASLFAARGLSFLLDFSRHRGRAWLLAAAVAPLLIWPVVDLVRALGQRSDAQMARLGFVYAHTGPAEPVLDGWLGTGVFRPSPSYYFFMHRELQAMLTPEQKGAYLELVARSTPALIALDDELHALGPRFIALVRHNYVSSDGLFYLRRGAQ